MKLLYKIIIMLAVIQLTIPLVNTLDIFPDEAVLYSDAEFPSDLTNSSSITNILIYFFVDETGPTEYFDWNLGFWASIMAIFIGVGAIASFVTRSVAPAVMAILIYMFIPMLLKSKVYLDKLFMFADNAAVMYMGIIIFVGIAIIALITIVEQATHGESG